jgi:diguanylate cyclase
VTWAEKFIARSTWVTSGSSALSGRQLDAHPHQQQCAAAHPLEGHAALTDAARRGLARSAPPADRADSARPKAQFRHGQVDNDVDIDVSIGPFMHARLHHLLLLMLGLALAWGVSLGFAGERTGAALPLVLTDGRPVIDAWPALRMLSDPDGNLSAADAFGRIDQFQPVQAPAGNLGPRRDIVWLQLPVTVADGDGRWLLDIDYPPLNDVLVYLVHHGQLRTLARLGSAQPFAERPLPTRSHTLALPLQTGQDYQLLLRVQTASAMVLPITLNKPEALQTRESHTLLSQGLMLGVALSLLAYSGVYGLSLREPLFALYAVMLMGSTAFFVDFFGIGQFVAWSERQGLTAMISPLSVLLAMAAGAQFVTRSMQMRQRHPRLYLALQLLSLLSAMALALGLLGLLSYRQTQLVATVVGPLVPLLVLPAAWQRARGGERVGLYMLLGWSAYLFGAMTMAGLLRGLLPANVWTQHLFQWGTALEMLAWLRVLGLHVEAARVEVQHSAAEKSHLQSLAHTDALTGLPNRRQMQLELNAALAHCSQDRLLAVCLADLDGFKAINDRLGHEAGDELLVKVSQRLVGQLRHRDIVARLGGDEFVILVGDLGLASEAQGIALKLTSAFDEPFVVRGQSCRLGLTVGYALAPQDRSNGAELLRLADAAMYAGKRAGGRQVRRCEPVESNSQPVQPRPTDATTLPD